MLRSQQRMIAPAIILMLILTLIPATVAAQGVSASKLSKHDRELLATARVNGETSVELLVASTMGKNGPVVNAMKRLGGTVNYRDDKVSYLRVSMNIDQVEAAATLPNIDGLDVDEVIPLEDPRPEPSGDGYVIPQTPPDASTPQINPYMPIGDTGAAQFMQANPTWDGRGVTIGILDSGVDLAHPALQTTTTGERKIIDWVTATHPLTDNDPTWVDMQTQVSGVSFTFLGATYTAPANATYRIGRFNERDSRLGGEVGNDVNRDGNPAGSSGLFGVLWDQDANRVYVDTNQNLNFSDDQPMIDYRIRKDVGTFGTDNPATPIVEQMPFVVQTNGEFKRINIGIPSGAHGSHVAGIMTANGMFGGAMTGAAPGAKLVSVRVCLFIAGCTNHALIEGMIFAASTKSVNVINMSIGGLPALNDANNARAILYDRLIDTWKVQIFISAGNSGPGTNTIGDPSVATKVMSVGSYITDETWESNYGSDSAYDDNMHNFTSPGPREDGGFKPDIIAPGSAISLVPTWQAGQPVAGTYDLPPGYGMFNGTSMASPQAAGAAALLVNAARVSTKQFNPDQLRQAMKSSARFIDPSRYDANEQGNGLINVGAAWDLLKTNIKTVDISSSVEVNTIISDFLETPDRGPGIYDREGVVLGQPYTRQYTFVRNSGGTKAITYQLSWVGNDGTFSSAGSISLKRNQPVTLDVNINPSSVGLHAAILNLDDTSTAGIDYQTMNVIIVADQLDEANSYHHVKSGVIQRNQVLNYFFYVPEGTPSMTVEFSGPDATPGTGQARFLRFHPYGLSIEPSTNSLACYSPPVPGGAACNPLNRTVTNPIAGVWEITVDSRRTSDVDETNFTLTVGVLGATVSPNPDVIPTATAGVPIPREYTITNIYGDFTGRAVGTSLGSARRGVFSINHLEQQQYQVAVAPGSTSLRATIGGTSDTAADLDLFLYNCTTGSCFLVAQAADGDSEESVSVANPASGVWIVLVDAFNVPAGSTTFNYVDVFANAAFGSVSITDADALRPAGSSWDVAGSVTANTAPAAGRVLLGHVEVRTSTNLLIGIGDVIVEEVTAP